MLNISTLKLKKNKRSLKDFFLVAFFAKLVNIFFREILGPLIWHQAKIFFNQLCSFIRPSCPPLLSFAQTSLQPTALSQKYVIFLSPKLFSNFIWNDSRANLLISLIDSLLTPTKISFQNIFSFSDLVLGSRLGIAIFFCLRANFCSGLTTLTFSKELYGNFFLIKLFLKSEDSFISFIYAIMLSKYFSEPC